MDALILKRASASRLSGEWSEDDYDVLCEGAVVGRIFKSDAAPARTPWMWTMLFNYRWPTHGYEVTREAAGAFKSRSGLFGLGAKARSALLRVMRTQNPRLAGLTVVHQPSD